MLTHEVGCLMRRHIRRRIHDIAADDIAHRPGELPALRDRTDDDIPIGQNAHRAAVVHHRHRPGIQVTHDTGGILDAVAWRYGLRVWCHYFANIHELLLCAVRLSWSVRRGLHNRASTWALPR